MSLKVPRTNRRSSGCESHFWSSDEEDENKDDKRGGRTFMPKGDVVSVKAATQRQNPLPWTDDSGSSDDDDDVLLRSVTTAQNPTRTNRVSLSTEKPPPPRSRLKAQNTYNIDDGDGDGNGEDGCSLSSVDTAEMVRRLRQNKGMSAEASKSRQNDQQSRDPSLSSSSTHEHSPEISAAKSDGIARSLDTSFQKNESGKDEIARKTTWDDDLACDQGDSDGEDSADTAELTRRLRANLAPKISATASSSPTPQTLLFRLPSQSESSSSEEDFSDDDEEVANKDHPSHSCHESRTSLNRNLPNRPTTCDDANRSSSDDEKASRQPKQKRLATKAATNAPLVLLDTDDDQNGNEMDMNDTNNNSSLVEVHEGLRKTTKNPRFNRRSRYFPNEHLQAISLSAAQHDSDIEVYSSDEGNQQHVPLARSKRGVMPLPQGNVLPKNSTQSLRAASMGSSLKLPIPASTTPPSAANSKDLIVGTSVLSRPWQDKRNIREVASGNRHHHAPSASSTQHNLKQTSLDASFRTESASRFQTAEIQQQRQSFQEVRNDVFGGSGAGTAGFSLVANHAKDQVNESIDEYNSDTKRPTARNRAAKKPAAPAKKPKRRKRSSSTTRQKSGGSSKRKKTGGRRGSWSGGKGGRGRGDRRGQSGGQNDVWGDGSSSGWQVSESFTREDPAMRQVGGADISF